MSDSPALIRIWSATRRRRSRRKPKTELEAPPSLPPTPPINLTIKKSPRGGWRSSCKASSLAEMLKKEQQTLQQKKSVPTTVDESSNCLYCHRGDKDEKLFEILSSRDVYGPLGTQGNARTHYSCAFFADGLPQRGKPTMEGTFGFRPCDIQQNVKKHAQRRCVYCHQKNAAARCRKCPTSSAWFHFTCGVENQCFFDYHRFQAFCPLHQPSQDENIFSILNEPAEEDQNCLICLEKVPWKVGPQQHRAACCKRFYHRNCLQQLCFSAAQNHLKCPHCNNVDDFQKELISNGFHIPVRDAAWEKDEDAFRDHYELPFECSAAVCYCPMGRTHDGGELSPYDQLICSVCGCNGVHRSCTTRATLNEAWQCLDCDDTRQRETDSENEDGDDKNYLSELLSM